METVHAPKLNAQNLPWFNVSRPLDLPDLKGKLVILDFWTFCCINCIHIIPTLKRIEEKFPDDIVVIGVHSPKFPGEKITENVARAIDRYEVVHPVVHDQDFTIWKNYAVRAWPTLIFIDPKGYIIGQLPGEPNADMLEQSLEKLIEEMKKKDALEGNAAALLAQPRAMGDTALRFPGKIAYSQTDDEFAIADSNHNQIVTANRQGKITRRIGSGKIGQNDGGFNEAEFYRPQGLCYKEGVIWVADTENHLLRKIDLVSGEVITIAGTGKQGLPLTASGVAKEIGISSPWDVSLNGSQLYFANAGSHQIGVFDIQQQTAGPFAGTGQEALVDGHRLTSGFAQTSGLSIGDNKLFLADSETSAIRSIALDDTGEVKTYVGTGLFDFGDQDGKGRDALIQHPLGVHYENGKVYIADSYNDKIRTLDVESGEVKTVEASAQIVCDDKNCTRLWEPAGVIKLEEQLYITDSNNHRILKIDLHSEKTEIFIG